MPASPARHERAGRPRRPPSSVLLLRILLTHDITAPQEALKPRQEVGPEICCVAVLCMLDPCRRTALGAAPHPVFEDVPSLAGRIGAWPWEQEPAC